MIHRRLDLSGHYPLVDKGRPQHGGPGLKLKVTTGKDSGNSDDMESHHYGQEHSTLE